MSPKILAEDLNIARKTLEDILPILRDSMDFQKAAAKYSTNEDTRNQGGKVINPATGGTRHDVAGLTSELNLILMSMKPGEISDPVLFTADDNSQSYVVYKLDNRIPAHLANMKDDYEIFRQVAENKAKVEETDKWVKKKIGATYILVDPDYLTCKTQFPWVKNKP
jgi:peptidyl-prolyl cis-trans isomerase SurA